MKIICGKKYIDKEVKVTEFKITKKINILENISIISFCFGVTTILYFLMGSLSAKTLSLMQFDDFFVPGASLLLAGMLLNKWANYELERLIK